MKKRVRIFPEKLFFLTKLIYQNTLIGRFPKTSNESVLVNKLIKKMSFSGKILDFLFIIKIWCNFHKNIIE